MILFIAPDPQKQGSREGYLQRVAAIDALFAHEKKLYSENLSAQELIDALVDAEVIYVHSIYQSEKILKSYPLLAEKIITDLHGAVPEELTQMGKEYTHAADHMAKVEKAVFLSGQKFVAVSQNMADYYTEKYNLRNVVWIILPIFEARSFRKIRKDGTSTVIYSGGTQPWQNVDTMVDAINSTSSTAEFIILTPHPEAFSGIDSEVKERTIIKSVRSDEVDAYYKKAALGFILRDDNIVNRVACPTKLIEYLNSGIVPIVLSSNIGDFEKLGYSYISLKNFKSGKDLSASTIAKSVEANYEVINKFNKIIEKGEQLLSKTVAELSKVVPTAKEKNLSRQAVGYSFEIMELQSKYEDIKVELAASEQQVHECSEHNRELQKTLNEIINSKRWRLATRVSESLHMHDKKS
jgi:glycosyltransferase involved in cell wall biosynthesis